MFFSFVQWNKYLHSVKDEMFHSTRLHLFEWNISSFTLWKYLYHCFHKHSSFVYYWTNNSQCIAISTYDISVLRAWLKLYAHGDLKNHTTPQSKAEGHGIDLKITEGLLFNYNPNKKQSIFVLYTKFKDSNHVFG